MPHLTATMVDRLNHRRLNEEGQGQKEQMGPNKGRKLEEGKKLEEVKPLTVVPTSDFTITKPTDASSPKLFGG